MRTYLSRQRRKNLFQWVLGYCAGGWVLLQVIDFAADNFGWPAAIVRGTTLLVVLGLLPTVAFAWYRAGDERPSNGRARRVQLAVESTMLALPLLVFGGWFASRAATPGSSGAGDQPASAVAVLYFEDRTGDPQLEYLATGLTESLIDELSAVPQLSVISANGVAPYRGKHATADSIGTALGVGTLVTGTTSLRPGERLRVDVRFVDARTGEQLEQTRIELPRSDVLAVQDSIAQDVAHFLRTHIGEQIRLVSSRVGTQNDAAWIALQQANRAAAQIDTLLRAGEVEAAHAIRDRTDAQLAAIEQLDPEWTQPVLTRGWLAFATARYTPSMHPQHQRIVLEGLEHAARALALEPDNPSAIELRGTLRYWQWLNNFAPDVAAAATLLSDAEADLTAATTHPAGRASAWNTISHLLINKGELAQAKVAAERAYSIDPWLTDIDRTIYRVFYTALDLGIPDEARKWCDTAQRRFPDDFRSTECRLWLYALPAATPPDIDEVWRHYDELVAMSPLSDRRLVALQGRLCVALALLRADMRDSALAVAETSQATADVDPRGELVLLSAIVYTHAGEIDQALDLMARYYAMNPFMLQTAADDQSWWLRDLRQDPRYQALIAAQH